MTTRNRRLAGGSWISVVAVMAACLIWELVCRLELVSPVLLRPPTAIVRAAIQMSRGDVLRVDLWVTFRTYLASMTIAILLGAGVGVLMGLSDFAYRLLNPFIVVLNALPKIVLMPLIVLWTGIGVPAGICLGALMAAFPILTSTYMGVRHLDDDFVLVARAFGAGRFTMLRTIVLPGVAPYLLSGLRIGVTYGMVGVLIAEFFASSRGIGYRMVASMANFQLDPFFVCLVIVAAFTLTCASVVECLERRVERWRPNS